MTAPAPHPASVRFRAGIGGEPVIQDAAASDAISFQPAPWGVWVVTRPGHPAPGERSSLRVSVGVGCVTEIRSSGAMVARRGDGRHLWGQAGGGSHLSVHASVASDAMLTWGPEPGSAADGGEHSSDGVVQLASSARLLWRDEFMIDRPDDGAAGTWRSRLRVTRDGWPVVSSELAIGPGWPLWESPAVLGGARAVSLAVVVDPGQPLDGWAAARTRVPSATGMGLPLNGPGVQIVAWGDDLKGCRAAVENLLERCRVPEWAASRWAGGRRMARAGHAGP